MFSKILEFCSGNGFLKVINHSLTKSFTLKVDPIGAIFQEILRSEWLQNFLINRDIPGILNVDNFQNSCHFAMSLLNQNIPFGIADITHNKLKLDVDGFKRLNKAVHFQSYFDNDLTLTYTIFVAPSEADQFFHQIQRQRKIWWAKISANPGRYYLSDIQGQNDEPLQVDIIAKYPFGEQKLEKIVLNKTLRSSSSNNLDLQIKDGRKTAQARFITCETKLSNLFLNGLCDAYDEAQYENGGRTRPFLRFHRKLAPFKIAFSISPTSWIGILSEWVKHEDVRLSIPATRALVNLNAKEERYQRHLYQLHPTYIDAKEPKVDVVFIHGLLGGVFFTWRQRLNTEISLGLIGKIRSSFSRDDKETLTQTLSSRNAPKKYHKKIKCSDPDTMQYIANLEEEAKTELSDFEVVLDDIPVNGNCTSNCGYTCKSEKLATCEDDDCYTYCWPRDWLPEDCDNLRVIGINYDTTLSKWNSFCPNMSGKTDLEEQSEKLLLYLQQAGLGKRPIVWITHSMGGLIAKNILCKAFASTDPNIRQICTNTKALVFYSTPHMGSSLATLNQASQLVLWPSIEVNNLRENSPLLLNLHENFLNLLRDVPIKIISFVETRKTVFTALKFNFQLVTPESGNTGIGEYYQIPLDHLEICKPISKFSFLYRKIVDLIQEVEDAV